MQEFINEASCLAKVSSHAAKAYDSRKGLLTERVNLALEDRNDLPELIGGFEARELMHDNHRNHAMFLTTVFHLNAFRLLASVVPWVYRTYKSHGFSYEYFPVALNAWKEAVAKELKAEEAAEIIKIYDWMLKQHLRVVELVGKLENQGETELEGKNAQDFYASLVGQDLHSALKLGEEEFSRESRPDSFYENTVRPAMYKIGNQWEKGVLSVADEHLATAMAQTVVSTLQGKKASEQKIRGKAIIASVTGELHELGARMIAHSFSTDGWDVTFLGANMPIADLADMARKNKPDFIGLSLAMPYYLHHLKRIIDIFAADPELGRIPIMVGGLVFKLFPEAAGYLPDAMIVNEINVALEKARELGNG